MKSLFFLLMWSFATTATLAQIDEKFLKESSSDAILVSSNTELVIESSEKSILKRSYELILKNPNARALKQTLIYYDHFRKVTSAEIRLLDLSGNEIKKFKLKDFDDLSAGMSDVASEGRIKKLLPSYSRYPFRLAVTYEVEKTGSLHLPVWSPQPEERLRIIAADFKVIDRSGQGVRYEEFNVPSVQIEKMQEQTTYQWHVENVEPFQFESFNYDLEQYSPMVYTAPNAFKMDGYSGDMSSWNSFGKWINILNENKNDLDPEKLQELDVLVKQAKDNYDKTRIIYNYLQKNTRYVSIQLGIGGWQPFSASYVHEKKYGDCKALSFYTKSLLRQYGIESYYTLIRAGRYASDTKANFPNGHFNHAILTVPISNDTLFLECTSQTNPFGFLGTFTSGRNALLITESGGKLIRTKKYGSEENVQTTRMDIRLSNEGAANIDIRRRYKGLEIENYNFHHLYYATRTDQNNWLLDKYRWNSVNLNSFELSELSDEVVPEGGFFAKLNSDREARKMGKRLFLNPGKYIDSHLRKISETERSGSINVRYGYTQKDSIIYHIPENHRLEGSSLPVTMETEYGIYQREIIQRPGEIMLIRKFIIQDGTYPPEDLEKFKTFVNEVIKQDRKQIVLVNKT